MHNKSGFKIDLLQYQSTLKIRVTETTQIWDDIRKKWLILQPEELVRQLFIKYLLKEKSYSIHRLQVEKELKINGLKRRFDLVIYDEQPAPRVLIELKAPSVPLDDKVFEQAAHYNQQMKVDYLIIANGIQCYCCKMDYKKGRFDFLSEIPKNSEIMIVPKKNT